MNASFNHFFEILPRAQKEIWPHLRAAKDLGFVLYRGTALALRLGHRQSIDFDFFTEKTLDIDGIIKLLPFIQKSEVVQSEPDTYTVLVPVGSDSVKVSFFGKIDFGRVEEPELTKDGNLLVASLQDILATKLKVLMQRIETKDYVDIAAILKNGVPLEYGLAATGALFGKAFSPVDCLRTLEYFEDPVLAGLDESVKSVLEKAVKEVISLGRLPRVELKSKALGSAAG